MFLSRVGVFTNHFFCGPLYILETRDIVCFVAIFIVLIVAVLNSLRKEADKIMTGLPIVIIVINIIVLIIVYIITLIITIIFMVILFRRITMIILFIIATTIMVLLSSSFSSPSLSSFSSILNLHCDTS